jgi:nuclear transport factor 2 (NTF2) superfamily protein
MEDIKHFAEAIGRLTPGRLDEVTKRATVKSIRNKIREFMSQWQRETNLTILKDVRSLD